MSYKKKYFKYKLKYLNLKNKLYGGSDSIIPKPPNYPKTKPNWSSSRSCMIPLTEEAHGDNYETILDVCGRKHDPNKYKEIIQNAKNRIYKEQKAARLEAEKEETQGDCWSSLDEEEAGRLEAEKEETQGDCWSSLDQIKEE